MFDENGHFFVVHGSARLASLINDHLSDVQPHIELGSVKRLSFAPTDLLSALVAPQGSWTVV